MTSFCLRVLLQCHTTGGAMLWRLCSKGQTESMIFVTSRSVLRHIPTVWTATVTKEEEQKQNICRDFSQIWPRPFFFSLKWINKYIFFVNYVGLHFRAGYFVTKENYSAQSSNYVHWKQIELLRKSTVSSDETDIKTCAQNKMEGNEHWHPSLLILLPAALSVLEVDSKEH